ncbi:hypothetical protein KDX16_28265 [Burkholderia vietnamiensis]|uniref:hypothetical protein n=1 Tax=Burkholderia vietnamiensis TaxID=60552 RepID=UPI001B8F879E|nr:hypothetical protein [Burkholderia vietnamiensis]MBR7919695.1 hypothetical protein [Burkholderia vietnamiensis]MBR8205344.1 hypothetical protein [Burkholderia vietnamiensis]
MSTLFVFAFAAAVALTALAYFVRQNPVLGLAAGFAWVMLISRLLQAAWAVVMTLAA